MNVFKSFLNKLTFLDILRLIGSLFQRTAAALLNAYSPQFVRDLHPRKLMTTSVSDLKPRFVLIVSSSFKNAGPFPFRQL